MLCVRCGTHTDHIYMTNYISKFAIVCGQCYTFITNEGNK